MLDFIFNNYYTILFVVIVFIGGSLIFFYKNNLEKLYNSNVLFITVFLYFLIWIPHGFDITDEGFTLSKSWFMFHGLWKENIDLIWASSLFNGMWLSVVGSPSVFWARLGYVILVALIAKYNYKILKSYFLERTSFLCTILLTFIIAFGFPQTANYQNIPTLFILLSYSLFIKADYKKSIISAFFSGFFIIIAAYCRFSVILLILYPIFYTLIEFYYYKQKTKILKRNIAYYYLGSLVAIICGIFILKDPSYVFNYVSSNYANDESHTISTLFKLYENELWLIFSNSFYIILITFLLVYILNTDKVGVFKTTLIFIAAFLLFYYSAIMNIGHTWIYIIFSISISFFTIYFIFKDRVSYKMFQIIFFSILLFFFSFAGSNNGFKMLIWSGCAIVPISTFILLALNTKIKIYNRTINFKVLQYILIIFSVAIIINRYKYVYRDWDRRMITSKFKTKELNGIRSNKLRVREVDSLMFFFKENIAENDIVMNVGVSPMIYYLSNKKYPLEQLWLNPKEDFLNNEEFPNVFLFSKMNTTDRFWPVGSSKLTEYRLHNKEFYKKFVTDSLYKLVYDSKMFEIYKKVEFDLSKPILNGLVAYFPFNGNANDYSGNNQNGKVFGAKLTKDLHNNENSAYYFDGKSHIRVENSEFLNPKDELTISAWYKPQDNVGSGADPIITKGFSSHKAPFFQYSLAVIGTSFNKKNGGTIKFFISPNKKPIAISTEAGFFKNNNWYFICGRYNGNEIDIFVNGEKIGSSRASGTIDDYGKNLNIGKGNNYNGFIKGVIDDVRIYNRSLDAFEIKFLYKQFLNNQE